jgi:hypothetical protein
VQLKQLIAKNIETEKPKLGVDEPASDARFDSLIQVLRSLWLAERSRLAVG